MSRRSKASFASRGFNKSSSPSNGHYHDRQVIFSQGDAADAMFRIQQGHVKLAVGAHGNQGASIAILRAGDCFGEGCLLGNWRRTHSATSVHGSTIDRVSRQVMARRLRNEPALARLFRHHLLLHLGRVEEDLVDLRVNSSEKRLARLLLQLSAFEKSTHIPVGVHVDQGTLAQVVGTTRSRVSYFMNRFRKKGYIEYNGSLRVRKGLLTFLNGARPPKPGAR